MPESRARISGWQGVSLIAVTYVYFLIFAQFAFLRRLAELGIAGAHLKGVMAAMALGGIVVSLLAPRLILCPSPRLRLRVALAVCCSAAAVTVLPLGLVSSVSVSFLIGCGLGLLTVTLVTHLRLWLSPRNPLLEVGLGTGIGYLVCNFPPLFTARTDVQALTAAAVCLAALFAVPEAKIPSARQAVAVRSTSYTFVQVLLSFTTLVWLDSAAFFIIQNTPALKADSWAGTAHLWINGTLHLSAAMVAVFCLMRRGLQATLSLAFIALAAACLLLLNPGSVVAASILYPVGVSVYSVALVAYPALLASRASPEERGRQAGWLYAIAGWVGSALGIGMAQNLHRVPPTFVVVAGLLIFSPQLVALLRHRARELGGVGALLLIAFLLEQVLGTGLPSKEVLSTVETGRHVYISEGCISCHSQYVRPNTADVLMWGPVRTVDQLREQRPPLIGNRRQGPDLTQVGSRRSPLWLKAHFYQPSELNHASFMPAYAYLFHDHRGDDLVDYLQTLQPSDTTQHLLAQQHWHLPREAMANANDSRGAQLFTAHCATCHTANGKTRRTWANEFQRLPPNLTTGPFLHLSNSDSAALLKDRLAHIVKFGLRGTNMAGHEYWPDGDIASLASWVAQETNQNLK